MIAATITVIGMASLGLGCPDSLSPAHERQNWIAQVVREPWATGISYNLEPGQPFSIPLTVSLPDTYSIRVWGRNSAGDGCQSVVVGSGSTIVGVRGSGVRGKRSAPRFDLQGRRIRSASLRSGWYSDTVVVR